MPTPKAIADITENDSIDRGEKITRLRRIWREARDLQRAATESALADEANPGILITEAEKALARLGANPSGPEDTSAATL